MLSIRSVLALSSFSMLSVFSLGCADPKVPVQETKEAPRVEAPRPVVLAPVAVEAPRPVMTESLAVADDIVSACKIARTPAPKFDTNISDLRDGDKSMLNAIAKCLTEGALKGRNVTLTGRADNRGETEHNMALGERRSSTAGRYLSSLGVKGSRLQGSSRGELDASGSEESGWQDDRRVDIELAK